MFYKNSNPIQLENPLYTAEEMAIVIEFKKQKRLAKGQNGELICFTIKENELKAFMTLLKKNRSSLPENTRFQFVYEHDGHWLSGDVRIKNGQLAFFIFDSLNSVIYLKHIINQIKLVSPSSKIIYVSGDKIQTRDFRNCGTFALDHAFNMSKIPDLHDIAGQLSQSPEATSTLGKTFFRHVRKGTLTTLRVSDFPSEFGALLRNMQSVSILRSSFFEKGYKANNKDSLKTYFKKNKAKIEIEGRKKKINNAIENKKEKLKHKARHFFDENDPQDNAVIVENRTGKNAALFPIKPKQKK